MSREHAILRAEPNNKVSSTGQIRNISADTLQKIFIEDVGSMHGTYVKGVKLQKDQPKLITSGAELLFGAEVSRGPGKQYNRWRLDLSHFTS
jgi:pSer/pThr/pTyr-binding forkhead associated (FHA) protein